MCMLSARFSEILLNDQFIQAFRARKRIASFEMLKQYRHVQERSTELKEGKKILKKTRVLEYPVCLSCFFCPLRKYNW